MVPRFVIPVFASAAIAMATSCAGGSPSPTAPSAGPSPGPSAGPGPTVYTGSFSGQMTIPTVVNGSLTCTSSRAISGTLRLEIEDKSGAVSGQASAQARQTETSRIGPPECERNGGGATPTETWSFTPTIGGSAAHLTFDQLTTSTSGALGLNRGTQRLQFAGVLNAGVVTGVLTYEQTLSGVGGQGTTFTENASTTMAVTIRGNPLQHAQPGWPLGTFSGFPATLDLQAGQASGAVSNFTGSFNIADSGRTAAMGGSMQVNTSDHTMTGTFSGTNTDGLSERNVFSLRKQ